jgi:hypothetical protein
MVISRLGLRPLRWATALVARKAAFGETEPLLGLFRRVLLVGATPALWMIIQFLPLEYIGIANPIWQSTRQALAIVGSIGVDTDAGLLAILLVTVAVGAISQKRAGCCFADDCDNATTVICPFVVVPFSRLKLFTSPHEGAVRSVGILGVPLAVTAVIRAFERWQLSVFPNRN